MDKMDGQIKGQLFELTEPFSLATLYFQPSPRSGSGAAMFSPILDKVKANTCVNSLTGCLAQTKLEPTGCCPWAKAWPEAIDQPVLALLWPENSSSFQHWVVPTGHGSGIGELESG